ncbi:MAG TPA: DUF2085 domain-containing protein [Anaerolineaceae bacterium]|nr:DUF2085 domain-containing protein [Anaerolineaceae bacterium]
MNVTVFRKENCPECDQVLVDLAELQSEFPHRLVVIEIEKTPGIRDAFESRVPVVEAGPYRLSAPISKQSLSVTLGAARDRKQQYEQAGDQRYLERVQRGQTISRSDRFSYWLSNHYMLLINLVLFLYVGLPFLAPVLMKIDAVTPARVIYTIYSPLCHQFAFRSFFLFGEQAAYPRAAANVPGITYEQVTGYNALDVLKARNFIGNEQLGYKIAICERDIAIYLSILLFGIIFSLSKNRWKSLPWYIWILFGILPIAVDGFSQLPSLMTLPVSLNWLPMRESTPLLRVLTGSLFGLTTAWFGLPYIEESMIETRELITKKIAVVSSRHAYDRG